MPPRVGRPVLAWDLRDGLDFEYSEYGSARVSHHARLVPDDGVFSVGASLRGCWGRGGDAVAASWKRDVSSAEDDSVDRVGALTYRGVEEPAAAYVGWEGGDEAVEVGFVSAVACECFAADGAVWL